MEARYLTDLEWRICHAVNIYVFRNGRDGEQPILVHIPPSKKKNMRTVMNVIQERVKYPVGYAKFLFKMDGTRIKDPCELEMYNNYVVASNFEKHFKCAAYGRKRSPLLVLNRESKHVRVLKLQNQNYYEWLLKKKAVGEERPAYIYPAYYTNENYRPQDLPLGNMGNYNPPGVQAQGCPIYPGGQGGGGRTYRIDGQNKYIVNTVTVDVSPDIPDKENPHKLKNGSNHRKFGSKIVEPTPSDMINVNTVISECVSPEVISVGTSETEEFVKVKNARGSKHHKKSKSHRVQVVTSEEYHEKQSVNVIESTSQSSVDLRKPKKSGRKSKKRERIVSKDVPTSPPAPPMQFRDKRETNTNFQLPPQQALGFLAPMPNNQDMINYDKAMHDPNGNVNAGQKTFYYSPEKLAEINSTGHIQPFELAFAHQQHPSSQGQWTLIQQPQQQILNPFYTLDPSTHCAQQTLIPANAFDNGVHQQGGMMSAYTSQNPNLAPSLQMTSSIPPPGSVPVIHAISSHPMFHQQSNQPAQCVVIPNTTNTLTSSHQSVQSHGPAGNVNLGAPQLVAVQSPTSQSHLQQVYQLGIVQQPNPQACIQVDAKAMRQYVNNQKMMGARYLQMNKQERDVNSHSEQTESELDIPYTPLKTYRLSPEKENRSQKRPSKPAVVPSGKSHGCNGENKRMNSTRYGEQIRLNKVRSRNVAIQMGHPGASARSSRIANYFDSLQLPQNNTNPFLPSQRSLILDSGLRDQLTQSIVDRTPRNCYQQRYLTPSRDRIWRNSFSDQYINSARVSRDYIPVLHNSLNSTRHKFPDPNLDELVTIPPPTEFRENEALHYARNALRHQQQNNYVSRFNHMYPYNNNDRSDTTSQYIHSQYP